VILRHWYVVWQARRRQGNRAGGGAGGEGMTSLLVLSLGLTALVCGLVAADGSGRYKACVISGMRFVASSWACAWSIADLAAIDRTIGVPSTLLIYQARRRKLMQGAFHYQGPLTVLSSDS
jgi:hypothetical protein